MSEPSNTAAEWMRVAFDFLNECESAPGAYLVTDDFYGEDYRRIPVVERVDGDEYVALTDQFWSVGSGRPRFTVEKIVAVRGDHLVAAEIFANLADGMGLHAIYCVALDPSLRLQRRLGFLDPEDRQQAVALLEQWQTELDY